MLVINLHTLQTIYVLDFVHNIFLYCCRTLNRQNISWSNSTIRQRSSSTYIVIFLNKDLLRQCYKVLSYITCLRCYNDFTVTTLNLTHCNFTINFWNHSRIRRITCFEQFGYTRQTTGNITSLTYCTRNLNQNITSFHWLTIFNNYVTAHRQVVSTKNTSLFISNMQRRNFGLILRFSNNNLTQTSSFIRFYLICNIFYYRFKVNLTADFSNDYSIKWIPFCNQLTFFYNITVQSIQLRTIRNVVSRKNDACIHVNKTQFSQTTYNYFYSFTAFFYSVNNS